jgi:crotonobetainyl-CoA:carnitine CoA-transferase CaiB-like acyl-CoA transferase
LFDGALAYLSMMWGESDESLTKESQIDRKQMTSRMRLVTRSFECADGEYLGVHTGAVGAFGRLMKVLGLDERLPPSETGMDIGVPLTDEEYGIVFGEIPKIFATRPRHEWVDVLMQADVCAVEHFKPTMVFDTPQARHNDMVVKLSDPVLGEVEQVAAAAKFSRTPAPSPRPAPEAGADSESVFQNQAGWPPPPTSGTPKAAAAGGLLDGLKVLDLGAYYAGPYSSRLLADLGADVIKLEPVFGDQLRGIERPFYSAQAGKRSIAGNLKDPRLVKAVEGLFEWADVVHHNLRPGAAERLGVDYESVRAINPDVVYVHAPGWGSTGPFKMRQSFAPMMSGYVGVSYEIAGQFNPPLPAVANEDPGNGLLGAVGMLMALLYRKANGAGQSVENSQLNATMAHLAHIVRRGDTAVGAALLDPLQFGIGPFERLYETSDGWIMVEARSDEQRSALTATLSIQPVGGDDDDAVADSIDTALRGVRTADAIERLTQAGVPAAVPVADANHMVMNDPRHRDADRIAERHHPVKGNVREIATLVRVSDATPTPHRLAPELGQHSDEILATLGYSRDEVDELRADGAIR